jgi:uncharacterized zinc-type alcohol dehydrogenase-like protein
MVFANFIFSASEPISERVSSINNFPTSFSDNAITLLFVPDDKRHGYFIFTILKILKLFLYKTKKIIPLKAYAAHSPKSQLAPFSFSRRAVGDGDVQVEILYCGVCHSDIHQVRDEWGGSIYPMVPGHEIVGKVLKVGKVVKKFKEGDLAGVGVMVDSCRHCTPCNDGLEQYCVEGMTGTYNTIERDGITVAQGGYSTQIVVDERYVHKISEKLDLKAVAPLLCAGITTYSPLKYVGVKEGTKVGVIGLGGLGHMGVKFAVSFGAEVTMLSTSPEKEKDARR